MRIPAFVDARFGRIGDGETTSSKMH